MNSSQELSNDDGDGGSFEEVEVGGRGVDYPKLEPEGDAASSSGEEAEADLECLPAKSPHFWKFFCAMFGLMLVTVAVLLLLAFYGWFSSPWFCGIAMLIGVAIYKGLPTLKQRMEREARKRV